VFKVFRAAATATTHFRMKPLVSFAVDGREVSGIVVESVAVAVVDVESCWDGPKVAHIDGHVERDRRLFGDRVSPEIFA